MNNLFAGAVEISHRLIAEVVGPGDVVVDATAGNGKDTLFLAELVAETGKVYAFDVQEEALDNTRLRLAENGCLDRVQLIADGHENLVRHVSEKISAAMFNLGYLPGGERDFITRPEATAMALEQAFGLLNPGGLVTVVGYTGHPGGKAEADAVAGIVSALPREDFDVVETRFMNRGPNPPHLTAVQKR